MLAERAVHAARGRRGELEVGDVARERVPEVDELALPVAEPARAEARRWPSSSSAASRAWRESWRCRRAGPPAMASQSTTACSSSGSSRMRSPRSCSRVEGSAEKPASRPLGARRGPRRSSPSPSRVVLSDLERAALEQRVDHLEQEEGVAGDARQELARAPGAPLRARRGAPRRDAPARPVVRPRSSMRMTPSSTWRDAVVGAGDEEHQDGQRILLCQRIRRGRPGSPGPPTASPSMTRTSGCDERDGREQVADARRG